MENEENEQPFDDFKTAQEIQLLRQRITGYAAAAVKVANIDRDWVNARLVRLGAEPVTGTAQYQINAAFTGNWGTTIFAQSRAEALEKFDEYRTAIANHGKLTGLFHGSGIYDVVFSPADPVFYSGPQDPLLLTSDLVTNLDDLKSGIRAFLKAAVTEQDWSYQHALNQAETMGLEPLPKLVNKAVQVPVTGNASVIVQVFDDGDEDAVQSAVTGMMDRHKKGILVVPDEIGSAFTLNRGGMSLELVDDGDEEHGPSFDD